MTNKKIKNIITGNAIEGDIVTGSTDQDKDKLSRTVTIRLSEKDCRMARLLAKRCGINTGLSRTAWYPVQ